jgi:AraC-like DNA-binding protein
MTTKECGSLKNNDLNSLLNPRHTSAILCQHYDVFDMPPRQRLLAWREKMGSIIDVVPTLAQLEEPFGASVNRYTVGALSYSNIYSDSVRAERSLARISMDRNCNFFLFTVCTDGESHILEGKYASRRGHGMTKILAMDLDQPIRMLGHQHRFSTFFAPRALVDSIVPDAESLHGRSIDDSNPIARLLISHTAMLNEQIDHMNIEEAGRALRTAVHLLAGAFGKQAKLTGNIRAATRAAIYGQVRRYIRKHLDNAELSAESVLDALQLRGQRDTLYRLFEHEGGIAAYICNCRLKVAAEDIAKFPHVQLKDIAYGVGFNSASAFSRAFKREYDMTPLELREYIMR